MMMSGNSEMEGGFLSALLGAIGVPMILKLLTGSGLHNSPNGGYKTHPKKIPIPSQNQPVIKQPEGTALINNKWIPYEPQFDNHEIIGTKGYGFKKKKNKKGRRDPIREFKIKPLSKRAFIESHILKFKNTSKSNTYLHIYKNGLIIWV